MALAEAAKLIATLDLGGNFVKNLGSADRALGKFDTHIDHTQSKAFQAGQKIGTGIKAGAAIAAAGVGILAFNIGEGLKSLVELEGQTAQTNAVIKATGGIAGVSAAQVGILAEKYESLNATVGDEVIRSGENLLLTFTNIKDKAFEPALASILDMNTALGRGPEGLNTTVTQVGKALQNPSKGLGQLERAIGKLDPKVKKQIDSLVKQGKLYDAQKVLLGELDKRYRGSFLAQGNTTAGKVEKFNDAIEDLQRALAEALLPALGNVADALSKFLSDPQTVNDIKNLGRDIAKLFSRENIQKGIDALKTGFQFLKDIAGTISSIVSTAVGAFTSLPPDIQKLLAGGFVVNKLTGGLVTDLITGIAKQALSAIGLMKVNAAVVQVSGPVTGLPGGGGGLPSVPGAIATGTGLGATLAGVATVGLTPAAIAGVGLAVDQAVDPNDSLKTIGIAQTATARGIADWNNQGIATLKTIATNTGDQKAIDFLATHGITIAQSSITSLIAAGGGADRHTEGPATAAELQDTFDRAIIPTTSAVETVTSAVNQGTDNINRSTGAVENAVKAADQQISSSGQLIQGAATLAGYTAASASRAAGAGIEATIRANRPIIDVQVNISATTIEKTVTVTDRNGPAGGSATDDLGGPGHPGR